MKRLIVAFRQDPLDDWVADLDCGHSQHIRHNPPWTLRPWVMTPDGRAAHIATELTCEKCEREGQRSSGPGSLCDMDVERTMEFILEQQAAYVVQAARIAENQARHDIAIAEMRENQIQLQKFQLAQEAAHATRQKALAEAMYHMVENLDKTTKAVDQTAKDVAETTKAVADTNKAVDRLSNRVDDFIRKTDERFAKLERDVDGLHGRN